MAVVLINNYCVVNVWTIVLFCNIKLCHKCVCLCLFNKLLKKFLNLFDKNFYRIIFFTTAVNFFIISALLLLRCSVSSLAGLIVIVCGSTLETSY